MSRNFCPVLHTVVQRDFFFYIYTCIVVFLMYYIQLYKGFFNTCIVNIPLVQSKLKMGNSSLLHILFIANGN